MNARELLIICLALVAGSIMLAPVSADLGLRGDVPSMLSSLSLLGGIAAAYMTISEEMGAGKDPIRPMCKKP